MYSDSMNINKALPVYAIIFTILLFFLQHISLLPPQAKSIDSPPEVFSAERAYETLKHLLQENKPHPVGSDLNKVIKYRLIEELEELYQARSGIFSPVHRGDQAILIQTIKI